MFYSYKKTLLASISTLLLMTSFNKANAFAIITPILGNQSSYTLQTLTQNEYDALSGSNKFRYYDGNNELYYSWELKNTITSNPRITANLNGADVNGAFFDISNTLTSTPYGGAIYLNSGSIGDIRADFINNNVLLPNSSTYAAGGAIYSQGTINSITGDFIGNFINTIATAYGGAIDNYLGGINNIYGNFIGNYALSTNQNSYGGAIVNEDGKKLQISANFIGNYATTSNLNRLAYGGAIWTNSDTTLFADGVHNILSGNYTNDNRGKIYNAIYIDKGKTLTLNTTNEGIISFYDNIDGSIPYSINLSGDGSGKINISNDIINAGNINISNTTLLFASGLYGQGGFKNSTPNLNMNNATFDLANGYIENINLKNYESTNSILHVDVNTNTMTADTLNINGNIKGQTKLVIYANDNKDIRGSGSILFANAINDTSGNENSFEVFRVYNSPYLYDIEYISHNPNDKFWGLVMNDESNPSPKPPTDPDIPDGNEDADNQTKVVSEVIAYNGLPTAAFEQTRSLKNSLFGNLNRINNSEKNVWANPIYSSAKTQKPFNIKADIQGLEGGFDLQKNAHHHLGIFASYRQGDYDLNGEGKNIYSSVGSHININSYLAGVYHRYQKNNFKTLSALGGGLLDASLHTNDGISENTNGKEIYAYFEAGKIFDIRQYYKIEPILSLTHTNIKFDDIHDAYGKTAVYQNLALTELEFALKLAKQNQAYEFYIKPSIVKVISFGDKVEISGMSKESAYDDNTLGRLEIGSNFEYDNHFSTYSFANYSIGSHYENLGLGIGLRYSW